MTIHSPRQFASRRPAGFDGIFDWDFLIGAFGPSIEPMDFDAVVERYGHFLVFETKDQGVPVPEGQRICLRAFARRPKNTVVIVTGKTAATIHGCEVWRGDVTMAYPEWDAAALRRWCEAWFAIVEASQRLSR